MHPLNVDQLCRITGGSIVGQLDSSAVIDGCVIDSRDVRPGDAFFALEGSCQHGVEFAEDAFTNGAAAVIVPELESHRCDVPHVTVPDAAVALSLVARQNRRHSDALVIGVTGSVGKTTTRGMIAAVLQTVHTGIQSPRNFNNSLGVPLSLLELQDGDEFAVIEVAASGPGEISSLSRLVAPEMAVVTRVSPAHINGFKSLRAVQQEKKQLMAALPDTGIAFLNADDPLVAEMARSLRCRVVTFGVSENADVRATRIEATNGRIDLTVNGCEYSVPVCGYHNGANALAAIAVGLEVGLDPADISDGLSSYQMQDGRCCVSRIGPWTVIDDTYNSSPASVTAATRTLTEFSECRHRLLVLGDMLDLGDQAADLHFGVGVFLASSSADHISLIGDFAGDVAEGFFSAGGHRNRISVFTDMNLLTTMLDCLLSDNDLVLVKGSRSTAMERVIEHLQQTACTQNSSLQKAA